MAQKKTSSPAVADAAPKRKRTAAETNTNGDLAAANSVADNPDEATASSNETKSEAVAAVTPGPDEDIRRVQENITNAADEPPTDEVDPNTARAEYEQRKQSQKSAIDRIGREKLVEMLDQMIFSRRFEEKCAEVYSIGKIGGFCHLYIGQEACAVGALNALRPDDLVISSYREHVHAIVKGISPDEVMAELYGKAGGCSAGKGGSMHMFDASVQFYGGHGIVGGQIAVATGMAFATKYQETDKATLCFFGEAAVNQGAFHESLNMAQLYKLPVIYICENNRYGMGTSLERAMSLADVSRKAAGYAMAGEFVDGMDVLAVYESVERAVKRAREESLPTLLEVRCYRYMGHSMSDPGNYRQRSEIEKYQERDPILLFTQSLKEEGIITDDDVKRMETAAAEAVERSVKFAEESPDPDAKELFTHIFA